MYVYFIIKYWLLLEITLINVVINGSLYHVIPVYHASAIYSVRFGFSGNARAMTFVSLAFAETRIRYTTVNWRVISRGGSHWQDHKEAGNTYTVYSSLRNLWISNECVKNAYVLQRHPTLRSPEHVGLRIGILQEQNKSAREDTKQNCQLHNIFKYRNFESRKTIFWLTTFCKFTNGPAGMIPANQT